MRIPAGLPDLTHWKAQVKCQAGCPVLTDAGRYVQLIADNRPEDAYLVARAPNPFASVCGRVCAAPCEGACRRGSIDAAVTIRALKRYVTEQYGVESIHPDTQAVFLSVGVSRGRDLQVPGVELDGVVKAIEYLLNVNRGYRLDLGRRVVVIGGGFVAFDAARTALRAGRESDLETLAYEADARVQEALDSARAALRGGAAEVAIVSLESFDEMPVLRTTQGHEEFEEARREGIRFITRRGPMRFAGNGRLSTVELQAVRSVFDANGRFAPVYDDTDVVALEADACVLAIGQQADLSFLTADDNVARFNADSFGVSDQRLITEHC